VPIRNLDELRRPNLVQSHKTLRLVVNRSLIYWRNILVLRNPGTQPRRRFFDMYLQVSEIEILTFNAQWLRHTGNPAKQRQSHSKQALDAHAALYIVQRATDSRPASWGGRCRHGASQSFSNSASSLVRLDRVFQLGHDPVSLGIERLRLWDFESTIQGFESSCHTRLIGSVQICKTVMLVRINWLELIDWRN